MQYKGSHKQNKKPTHTKKENICKWWSWQGSGLQNLQTAHENYYDQNKQPNQKKKKKRTK